MHKTILAGILMIPATLLPYPLQAEDVPMPVKTFKANDKTDRYVFTWSKAGSIGANGGSVTPGNVTYILEELNASYESARVIARTKDLTYTYAFTTRTGEQDLKRFGLRASNSAGESEYAYVRTIIGKPYNVPFHESFAIAATRSLCWQEGDGTFTATTSESSDGDYGCMECVASPDGTPTSFNLGKILLSHTKNPIMSFCVKGLGEGETFTVKVARSDGAEGALKKVAGPIDEWTEIRIDLSNLLNEEYIIPKFVFTAASGSVFLDDIRVEDPYSDDLGVTIKCDEDPYDGSDIEVTVRNEGLNETSGGTVEITGEEGTRISFDITETLSPGDTQLFFFNITDTSLESIGITAKVNWPYDLNPCNDTATIRLITKDGKKDADKSDVTVIEDLKGATGYIMTIDGRTVTGTPESLPAGIYISGGKKIIIK